MREISLQNSKIKVVILPDLGGRVDSLIHKASNKEWVWKNKYLQNKKVSKFSTYDENWQGGWEELFPNDAIENFSWGSGFDHGELWSNAWKVDNISKEQVTLIYYSKYSGTTFKKIFSINKNKFECRYFANIAFEDNFLFKLHLAIPIEKKIKIICDVYHIEKVEKNFGNILQNEHNFLELLENSKLFDFAYLKIKNKEVRVVDSDKNILVLKYGKRNLDFLWIFQTQGGWNNHNVLVLEPASNSKKILKEAKEDNNCIKGPMNFECYYEVELK